jgi:hypothetical protein
MRYDEDPRYEALQDVENDFYITNTYYDQMNFIDQQQDYSDRE